MRYFLFAALLFGLLLLPAPSLYSYSVLTHEFIVDSLWNESIERLLRQRFPASTAEMLKQAHAYAYGGSIIQDMGYYPFGSHFFTDLTHYVRSGDFITAMLRDSQDINEYAFALGALAHYAADNNGHRLAINRAVPLLYPKLLRKFGKEVTYSDDASSHLKTEFGFDVLQVAKGRYPPDAYRDFIGFEVSKPLMERAFNDTYGLELDQVFRVLDLAIGTYRKSVSSIIPKMTKLAWELKKDEILKTAAGTTRREFIYHLHRSEYEKQWGKDYTRAGIGSRFLAFLIRIVPKVGPFRTLGFRTPTPETEKMFLDSVAAAVERYRALLAAAASQRGPSANLNLDLGEPTAAGMYKGSDETYAKLVDELAAHQFAGIPSELRADILNFYKDETAPIVTRQNPKQWAKLQGELEALKAMRN